MIRGDVLKWAAIALLAVFAFMLLPTYEHFTSNQSSSGSGTSGTTIGQNCPWPQPTAHRAPVGMQSSLIPKPPYNTRTDAQKDCDTNPECKGVARFGNWYGMAKTTETAKNDGDFDFTEKPKCVTPPGNTYSSGNSRSDPPVDNIIKRDTADTSNGMLAGAGYGPGAMYGPYGGPSGSGGGAGRGGDGSRNSAKPWFQGTEEDNYIAKSALVPCTCTTHSMGCPKHSGGSDQSQAPGDMDKGGGGGGKDDMGNAPYARKSPDQYGIMKPFSRAFANQEEPSGFLNTFNAFMR